MQAEGAKNLGHERRYRGSSNLATAKHSFYRCGNFSEKERISQLEGKKEQPSPPAPVSTLSHLCSGSRLVGLKGTLSVLAAAPNLVGLIAPHQVLSSMTNDVGDLESVLSAAACTLFGVINERVPLLYLSDEMAFSFAVSIPNTPS